LAADALAAAYTACSSNGCSQVSDQSVLVLLLLLLLLVQGQCGSCWVSLGNAVNSSKAQLCSKFAADHVAAATTDFFNSLLARQPPSYAYSNLMITSTKL
jgi:hypothetical protein